MEDNYSNRGYTDSWVPVFTVPEPQLASVTRIIDELNREQVNMWELANVLDSSVKIGVRIASFWSYYQNVEPPQNEHDFDPQHLTSYMRNEAVGTNPNTFNFIQTSFGNLPSYALPLVVYRVRFEGNSVSFLLRGVIEMENKFFDAWAAHVKKHCVPTPNPICRFPAQTARRIIGRGGKHLRRIEQNCNITKNTIRIKWSGCLYGSHSMHTAQELSEKQLQSLAGEVTLAFLIDYPDVGSGYDSL